MLMILIAILLVITILAIFSKKKLYVEIFKNKKKYNNFRISSKCIKSDDIDYNTPEIIYKKLSQNSIPYSITTLTRGDILNILTKIDYKRSQLVYKEPKKARFSIWDNKNIKPYSFEENNYIKVSKYVENKVLDKFNKFIESNITELGCAKKKYCIPKVIKRKLVKIELNNQVNVKYFIVFEIFIKNKLHSHIFYSEIENINNNIYLINLIKLLGINFGDKLQILPGIDKNDKYINIYSNPIYTKYNLSNGYFKNSDEQIKILRSKKYNKKLVDKYLQKQNDHNEYRCFNKQAFNKRDCENNKNELGQKDIVGIWDKKCIKDEECPFYKKNKNYKNKRGGCINGKCELPLGIKRLGYRYYDKNSKGLCYNCKTSDLRCCNEQKKKKLYPKLLSPDYVFSNDFEERNKNSSDLKKIGAKIY